MDLFALRATGDSLFKKLHRSLGRLPPGADGLVCPKGELEKKKANRMTWAPLDWKKPVKKRGIFGFLEDASRQTVLFHLQTSKLIHQHEHMQTASTPNTPLCT